MQLLINSALNSEEDSIWIFGFRGAVDVMRKEETWQKQNVAQKQKKEKAVKIL